MNLAARSRESGGHRVAILTNYPADFVSFSGGVETATAGLLEGLRAYQSEFEFHVVSVPGGLVRDCRSAQDGFHYHFLSVPPYRWMRPRLIFRVLKAQRELQHIAPDLIHCQDNMALALATLSVKCPRVFTVHGVKRHESSKRAGWERWSASADALLERFVYRQFDDFIAISGYARDVIGSDKRVFCVANPVRSLFFNVQPVPSSHPILLFVGVLDPLKRALDLIQAHNRLRDEFPDLETVLCGASEDDDYLRRLRAEAKEGVQFAGLQNQRELTMWLSQARALVLPSSQENCPIVIAEAMAAGVPVVATRVGGVPEMVVGGESGFLYHSGDVDDLIDCLRRLLNDPQLSRTMGQTARWQALEKYHPSKIAQQTVEVYRALSE